MTDYSGKCCCGTVSFVGLGDPVFTQYCHCNKCREMASLSTCKNDKGGYAYTAAYLRDHFKIDAGEEKLEPLIKLNSTLFLCSKCRSLIYGLSLDPEKQNGIGVNAYNFNLNSPLPDSFKPVRHIWYANRIINVNDGLPKFKDAPKGQNGTGELYE